MILECPYCRSRRLSYNRNVENYTCKICNMTFQTPMKIDKMNPVTIALIATMIMVAFTVIIASLLYTMVIGFKPAIYLYTPKEEKEQLKLKVKGVITKRIPFRTGIKSITWNDLKLSDGKITTNSEQHDYLFYESKNEIPKVENVGWVLKKSNGKLTWNQRHIEESELSEIFQEILTKYGLFEHEINDFIDYWLDKDMKIFFGNDDFTYGIYPVSVEELDRIFTIETELEYPEYLRVQFLMKEIDSNTTLAEPEFPDVSRSGYALHEWGIMKA